MLDFSKVTITVIGDVMLDTYIYGSCDRVSPEAPVPVVNVNKFCHQLGGAANVALNITSLGARVALFGSAAVEGGVARLWRETVPADNLFVLSGSKETKKTRVIANGQQVVRYDQDAHFTWEPEREALFLEKAFHAILTSNAVILADYNKGFLTDSVSEKLVAFSARKSVPCFVDPKDGWGKFSGCFCLKPNKYELERNYPGVDWHGHLDNQLRGICRGLNIDNILLTLGEGGMVLASPDDFFTIRSRAKEVFDVSGAGDTAIATLATAYSSGLSMKESAILANQAAGIVVGKRGTRPITIEELNQ